MRLHEFLEAIREAGCDLDGEVEVCVKHEGVDYTVESVTAVAGTSPVMTNIRIGEFICDHPTASELAADAEGEPAKNDHEHTVSDLQIPIVMLALAEPGDIDDEGHQIVQTDVFYHKSRKDAIEWADAVADSGHFPTTEITICLANPAFPVPDRLIPGDGLAADLPLDLAVDRVEDDLHDKS